MGVKGTVGAGEGGVSTPRPGGGVRAFCAMGPGGGPWQRESKNRDLSQKTGSGGFGFHGSPSAQHLIKPAAPPREERALQKLRKHLNSTLVVVTQNRVT